MTHEPEQSLHARRNETGKFLLLHAAFFFFLLSPFLLGFLAFSHTDALQFEYPLTAFMKSRLFSSAMLWNDLGGQGFPTTIVYGYGFHIVLQFLLLFLSPMSATHWTMFLSAVIGALFFSKTLRLHGFSLWASFLAGAIYPLTLWSWIFAQSIFAFIPVFAIFLYVVSRYATEPWKCGVLACATLTFGILTLQAHYAFLFLAASFGYILWTTRELHRNNARLAWKFLGSCIAAGIIAIALTVIRWLPLLAYGLLSPRTLTHGSAAQLLAGGIGPGYLLQFLFPETYVSFALAGSSIMPYIGVLPLALACIAMCVNWRKPWVWMCMAVFALTLAIAIPHSPVFWLLLKLPFIGYLGENVRYLLLGTCALLPLVAQGFDDVMARAHAAATQRVTRIFMLIGVGAVAISGFAWLGTATKWIPGPDPHYSMSDPKNILPLLSLFIAGMVLQWDMRKRIPERIRAALMGTVSVVLVFATFFFMGVRQNEWRFPLEFRSSIAGLLGGDRGLSVGYMTDKYIQQFGAAYAMPRELLRMSQGAGLHPNMNFAWSVKNAAVLEHMRPVRMARLLHAIDSDMPYGSATAEALKARPWQEDLVQIDAHRPLLKVLGIEHIVSPLPLEAIGFEKEWKEDVIPAGQMIMMRPDGSTAETPALYLAVYRAGPHPLAAYAPASVLAQTPDAYAAYDQLMDAAHPHEQVIIECFACKEGKTAIKKTGSVRILTQDTLRTEAEVDVPQKEWIVFSKPLLPGWHALVDGKRAEEALAQTVFAAVNVPAGRHAVSLEFSLRALVEDSMQVFLHPADSLWLHENSTMDPEQRKARMQQEALLF